VAQLVVRNIEKEVKVRLQRRASRNGRSMEAEVRDILRDAVKEQDVAFGGWVPKSPHCSPRSGSTKKSANYVGMRPSLHPLIDDCSRYERAHVALLAKAIKFTYTGYRVPLIVVSPYAGSSQRLEGAEKTRRVSKLFY
jgi:hypothetical protein